MFIRNGNMLYFSRGFYERKGTANMRLNIDQDQDSIEIHNPHSVDIIMRGLTFPPGSRMVRWFNQVPYTPGLSEWDREDDTASINGGYQTTPVFYGWCRPWGNPYGGVTGGEDIDMLVTADSSQELQAMYRKAERILDRMPDRGHKLSGYRRFDWQHIRRATGTLQVLADRGDARAKSTMVRWGNEWIEDHEDQLAARTQFVNNFPDRGVKVGRDHGWGLLLMLSCYKYTGSAKFKDTALSWMSVISKGQTRCGLIQRTTSDKLYGSAHGKVGFWQCYEHAFIMNALWEWKEELSKSRKGFSLTSRVNLQETLFKGSVGIIDSELWDEDRGGIIRNCAHGDSDPTTPSLCSNFSLHSSGVEGWYAHNLFAMAYTFTGDTGFIEKGQRLTPHSGANAALWLNLSR
jgi:hypothetical protein